MVEQVSQSSAICVVPAFVQKNILRQPKDYRNIEVRGPSNRNLGDLNRVMVMNVMVYGMAVSGQ